MNCQSPPCHHCLPHTLSKWLWAMYRLLWLVEHHWRICQQLLWYVSFVCAWWHNILCKLFRSVECVQFILFLRMIEGNVCVLWQWYNYVTSTLEWKCFLSYYCILLTLFFLHPCSNSFPRFCTFKHLANISSSLHVRMCFNVCTIMFICFQVGVQLCTC